jgi:hypothetical protein
MFGSVMAKFQIYMVERLGTEGWKTILIEAGLPAAKNYHTIGYYPDEELELLLRVAAVKLGVSRNILFRDLGKDFGIYLISCYRMMFRSGWRTLDIIEKVAPKVFKISQLVDPKAPPSEVTCDRISPIEVIVHYNSPRKMCPYIFGIIDATGEYFEEKIWITHVRCMLEGAPECEIHVKLLQPKSGIMTSRTFSAPEVDS